MWSAFRIKPARQDGFCSAGREDPSARRFPNRRSNIRTAARPIVRTLVTLALLSALPSSAIKAQDPQPDSRDGTFFTIGTGSIAGAYFRIGDIIAGIISHPRGSVRCQTPERCGPEGLIAVAQASEGSVRNVVEVNGGIMQTALAQADIVHWASQGREMFAELGGQPNLRVIANLYPETIHLVARSGAGIESLADLVGKTVSIDRRGSGTYADAHLILKAIGLAEPALTLTYLDPDMAATQIETGEIDAFFYTAGAPIDIIASLIEDGHATLVPVAGPAMDALRADHTFLLLTSLPAGTYPEQEALTTLGVGALWIVHKNADANLVYQITRALWHEENRRLLTEGHPLGLLMKPEQATVGVPVPLHPGAKRFYREYGSLTAQAAGPEPHPATLLLLPDHGPIPDPRRL